MKRWVNCPPTHLLFDSQPGRDYAEILEPSWYSSFNGRRVSLEQELQKALEKELVKNTDKTVIFKGDKNVLLGETVKVLDIAKKAGDEKISIAAEKTAGSP